MERNELLKTESDPLAKFSDMNSNYPLMMSSINASSLSGISDFSCDSSLAFMEWLNVQADFGASVTFEQLLQQPSLSPANVGISEGSLSQMIHHHYPHQESSSEVLNSNNNNNIGPATPNSSSIISTESSGAKTATNDEHLVEQNKEAEDGDDEEDEEQQGVEDEHDKKQMTKKQLKPKKTSLKKQQREPRFAFMTKTEVDHLEDGYRWRKYGQKAVKNSPFPRSYYRCTNNSCNVKKRVERCFNDPSVVVTTYEGKHTHPSPFMPHPSHEVINNTVFVPPMCSDSAFPTPPHHELIMGSDQSLHDQHLMNAFHYGYAGNFMNSGRGAHQLSFISEPSSIDDHGHLLPQDVKNED